MSSTPLTDNALSRPAGLMVSLRLLAAIVIFAAIAPGILMTAPAVAAQLASEWQLKPGQIGWLFSAELGAMSLATLPAWWWMSRLDWRRVALTAGVVFLAANLVSAVVTQYETLLAARFIASLAGGTLMILCISCAAGTPNPSRVYAFWVLGQLLLGMLGLLALPGLFATFGLKVVYLILAAIMLCCLPLVSAFPPRFQPLSVSRQQPSTALWRQALAVLAVLTFYISLSAVWTFIGTIGSAAGLSPTQVGLVLAAATVCGIIGPGGAAVPGAESPDAPALAERLASLAPGADLAALAESRPLQVRFIEMMPIGYGAAMPCISGPELRERFARRWPEFSPLPAAQSAGFGDGPAVYYTVPGWKGDVGFIAAVHGKFCASCNRVRLTSQGFLRPCLASETGCDLRTLLRGGAADEELLQAIRETIWSKPREHHFGDNSMPATRGMYRIGG